MIYVTQQGDMLDAICKAQLGSEAHVVAVFEANPHLADLGPVYPAGVSIVLPQVAANATRPTIRLWGTSA